MILSPKSIKFIIAGLAFALILFAGWSIYNSVDYGKKKANFLQDKVERENRIKMLEIEKAEAKTEANLSAEAAKVVAKERDLVMLALEKEREKHIEKIEKVEKMEPDEVVSVAQRLLQLGMEHIYRNPEGVQFSLVAAKQCVVSLTYLDFYLSTEKPALVKLGLKGVEEAKYWHEAYATLSEGALATAEGIIVELREQVAEDDAQLKRAEKQIKRASLKATVTTVVAVGVAVAVIKWIVIPLFGGK